MLNKRGVVVLVVVFSVVHSEKSLGDLCNLTSGEPGQCILFNKCEKAREDLRKYRIFPETCGFETTVPIVCCPSSQRTPGEISATKCAEYSKIVFRTKPSPVNLIHPPKIRKNECGHKVVKLIIGGEKTNPKEFPHMAVIGFEQTPNDWSWNCGGTILSEQYVLTAAHCLSDLNYGDAKRVRIGITNLNDQSHLQEFNVSERIVHPEYSYPAYYHDIGLIKLDRRIRFNGYARPACLYSKSKILAKRGLATGWGDTTTSGNTKSEDLLKVALNFVDNDSCNVGYKNYASRKLHSGILDNIQLCAGSDGVEMKDTCMGDSGGPLQIYHIGDNIKCMYDIIGVTSFGKPCSGAAGVYVRVSHYIKWIEDIVWPPA